VDKACDPGSGLSFLSFTALLLPVFRFVFISFPIFLLRAGGFIALASDKGRAVNLAKGWALQMAELQRFAKS
jgi:hypothetical protein